jgi:hypothetical protein
MREITIHKAHEQDRQPKLYALGHPTIAGAEQDYRIVYEIKEHMSDCSVHNGPALPAGPCDCEGPTQTVAVDINFVSLERPGITNEVLLAIDIDRLEGFQAGKFPCHENFDALTHCRAALNALHRRTLSRVSRGVENQAKA